MAIIEPSLGFADYVKDDIICGMSYSTKNIIILLMDNSGRVGEATALP